MRNGKGQFIKGHKSIGGFKKGHITNVGRKLTKKHKERISESNKGRISPMKGRQMPFSAKKAISKALKGKPILKSRGKKHYNWKGGRSQLQKIIRHSAEYNNWRIKIFIRDKHTCVLCGDRNGRGKRVALNVDHYPITFSELLTQYKIKTFEDAINCKTLWKPSIGRTLCVKCHRKTYKFWRNQYGTRKTGNRPCVIKTP